ncbi:winged helix-turn-helix domain-containing protein, partial [Dactylosporangium sp. NPDC000555]|uniref:winged helix-turn-helix domain-containing protein n=1 Tax=Dactylosporangium sp. NPDC000555 TaxID=3154260 RepID=UPI00331FC433
MLGALLMTPNIAVNPDELIEHAWEKEPPTRVRNALSSYITRLRQRLAAGRPVNIHRFRSITNAARAEEETAQVLRRLTAIAWRLAVAAMAWLVAGIGHNWYGNRHHFADLRIYHLAVQWWRDGRPLHEFSVPDPTQGSLGFTYPPFAALLLRPLAGLAWPVPVQV